MTGGVFEGVGGDAGRGVHRQTVGVSGGESKGHVSMVFANILIYIVSAKRRI